MTFPDGSSEESISLHSHSTFTLTLICLIVVCEPLLETQMLLGCSRL